MADDVILAAESLRKEFLGFVAVDRVDLKVRRGSIHALIGPNGAGKTTVFNLLTKFIPCTAGRIVFDGEDITREKPAQIARRGMVRSFQMSAVFPSLTVLENVRIALQRKAGLDKQFWLSAKVLSQLNDHALAILTEVDLHNEQGRVAVELPYGRKRALELATTLALEPRLLLLDEPTQGMGHEDVSRVTALIKKVAQGRTVLMVEHNLGVVSHLCDVITVLQRGNVLAEGPYEQVSKDPRVLEAYIGGPA